MKEPTYITELIIGLGIMSILTAGMFGAFGAVVHYLYLVVKETEEYRLSRMFSFTIMGFFVGLVVNELLIETTGKTLPGIVLISGFLFLKILEFFDESGMEYILRKLGFKKI